MISEFGNWLMRNASTWETLVLLTSIALVFAIVGKISYRQGYRNQPELEYVPPEHLRVQITTEHGPLLDVDTDWLHNTATYLEFAGENACGYNCLPRCEKHGWYPLFEDAKGLVMRVRPVH